MPFTTKHRSVYHLLLEQIRLHADRPALLVPGKQEMTFHALGEQITAVRGTLGGLGFGRGSRVGIMSHTRDAFAAAYLGVISCATAIPLNPDRTQEELEFAFADFKLDAVLTDLIDAKTVSVAGATNVRIVRFDPDRRHTGMFTFRLDDDVTPAEPEPPQLDDVVVMTHTSGTTGRPKIVPRTHRNGLASLENEWKVSPIGPADRALNVLPLFNAQGLLGDLQPVLLRGASVAFTDFSPENFESAVSTLRPTFFTLVPTMHQAVMKSRRTNDPIRADALRFIRSSSAALTEVLKHEVEAVYGVPVVHAYGSSEAGGIAMSGIDPATQRSGSVGRPLHDDVAIMDEEGNLVANGVDGEVCISGPAVMPGYVDNDDANAEAFRDGWYRSGDLGHIDSDGFLFLTGRIRETVNRGGELISPQRVDEVLESHECVSQAVAFGVPDEAMGDEIIAALVLRDGCDVSPGAIRGFAARHLSFSWVPKRIAIVDEIPVNSSGKKDRRRLTREFS